VDGGAGGEGGCLWKACGIGIALGVLCCMFMIGMAGKDPRDLGYIWLDIGLGHWTSAAGMIPLDTCIGVGRC
jgi:hypothetical protein